MNLRKLLNYALVSSGFIVISSCINNDLDFSKDINLEMTFGGNYLAFPLGSMDTVFMTDIIDTTDNIKIVNGKYLMSQKDGISETKIVIGDITIKPDPTKIEQIRLTPDGAQGAPGNVKNFPIITYIEPKENNFNIDNEVTDELEIINRVDFEKNDLPECHINIRLYSAAGVESAQIEDVKCILPDFIVFEEEVENGIFYFNGKIDVAIGQNSLSKTLKIKSLDFSKIQEGGVTIKKVGNLNKLIVSQKIKIESGKVIFDFSDNIITSLPSFDDMYLDAEVIVDDLNIAEVTGKFNPEIDNVEDKISIDLGDDADFLKENASLDFSNPKIYIDINNSIKIPVGIDMEFWGEDALGNEIPNSRVEIKDIIISAADENGVLKSSKWVVCKNNIDVQNGYQQKISSELSNLLKVIPDNIRYIMKSKALGEQHSVNLKKDMIMNGGYDVQVPLEFDNMDLIYTETIDGLQSDLEDISDLQEEYEVHLVVSVVNSIPLNMEIEAVPLDIEKKEISSNYIVTEVEGDIAPGISVENPTTSEIKVKLLTYNKGFKDLDGLDLKIKAKSNNTKVTFEESQFLLFKNMKIKIIGGITIDGN